MIELKELKPGGAELAGFIPYFLSAFDKRPAKEQFKEQYVDGWTPFRGFKMDPESFKLSYPDDPPYSPVARIDYRDEIILIYPHAWVAIVQKDGSYEVARMD